MKNTVSGNITNLFYLLMVLLVLSICNNIVMNYYIDKKDKKITNQIESINNNCDSAINNIYIRMLQVSKENDSLKKVIEMQRPEVVYYKVKRKTMPPDTVIIKKESWFKRLFK